MQNDMKKNKPQIGAVNWRFLIEKLNFPNVKIWFHIDLVNDNQLFKTLDKFGRSSSNMFIKSIIHGSSIVKARHFGQCFNGK